jgi:dihydroorotase
MPSLTLTNFRALGFEGSVADRLHIGGDGLLHETPEAGAETLDCKGSWLSPGWADLHVHVWHGGTDISVRADQGGLARGVTAMADAGSAGEANFHGLREYVLDKQPETIRAFLNIGSIGLVACNRVSELIDMRSIDVDRTLAVIEANRDVICGLKVRASGVIVGAWGITPLKIGKRVAEIAGLPVMVHVGEMPPALDEVLAVLTPGDVVTHCFNGKQGGSIADTPALTQLAKRLAAQGVLMDIGHGAASFSFRVARQAIGEGLKPYSISTDLHLRNVRGPVYDLATTVSKVLAAGLPFEDCITAITTHPRRFLKLASSAAPGARADFTLFDLVDCNETVFDSTGDSLRLEKMIEPRLALLGPHRVTASRAKPEGQPT